jgi:DNA-directed RNA polymerase subunit RPC12/RpoP
LPRCHRATRAAGARCELLESRGLQCASPLLAQSGHRDIQCPLSGTKRILRERTSMSAYDPKRTLSGEICCAAMNPLPVR